MPTATHSPRDLSTFALALFAAVVQAGCDGSPARGGSIPASPRVAEMMGSLGHPCQPQSTPSFGGWCDRNTGMGIDNSRTSGGSVSSPPSRPSAPARDPVTLPIGEAPYLCRSASGLEDTVVAPDRESARRDCATMTGEPCDCRIPDEARGRGDAT